MCNAKALVALFFVAAMLAACDPHITDLPGPPAPAGQVVKLEAINDILPQGLRQMLVKATIEEGGAPDALRNFRVSYKRQGQPEMLVAGIVPVAKGSGFQIVIPGPLVAGAFYRDTAGDLPPPIGFLGRTAPDVSAHLADVEFKSPLPATRHCTIGGANIGGVTAESFVTLNALYNIPTQPGWGVVQLKDLSGGGRGVFLGAFYVSEANGDLAGLVKDGPDKPGLIKGTTLDTAGEGGKYPKANEKVVCTAAQ